MCCYIAQTIYLNDLGENEFNYEDEIFLLNNVITGI